MDLLESKIIKQVEYYFSDVNLSRDKFMKDTLAENNGWIPFETMIKFNRLKALSEDIEVIRNALLKSTSGLLEVGENGIRRCPEQVVPDSVDEVFEKFKDRSIYVKGFGLDSNLDDIIDWLETHGGKTLNVHMRRYPDSKNFKGSVFVIFEKKDDAERLLTSNDAASYKGNDMIRKYREDYLKEKKEEKDARARARAAKNAASEANQRDYVTSRMVAGALLELCGLPKVCKENQEASANTNGKPVNDGDVDHSSNLDGEQTRQPGDRDNDNPGALTIIALKQWLSEKLGEDYSIAWIDVEPAAGKGLVRFKAANTAESALNRLRCAFGDQPIVYANSELTGRVLSGDEEFSHWKTIIAAQQQKAQKRRGERGGGRGGGANKRRRMN